ncbi:MAG: hypothetical protein HY556_04375 [Euryarchaeota archaeon]|nr:hypothetical protein [Euryarchaeota archaeon]
MDLTGILPALSPTDPGPPPLLEYIGPGLLFFFSSLAIGFWIAIDANLRGRSAAKWVLAGIFLNVFGLLLWLAKRPKEKVAPEARLNTKEQMRKARTERRGEKPGP